MENLKLRIDIIYEVTKWPDKMEWKYLWFRLKFSLEIGGWQKCERNKKPYSLYQLLKKTFLSYIIFINKFAMPCLLWLLSFFSPIRKNNMDILSLKLGIRNLLLLLFIKITSTYYFRHFSPPSTRPKWIHVRHRFGPRAYVEAGPTE